MDPNSAPPSGDSAAAPSPRARWRRRLLLLAGPVLLAAAGLFLYLHSGRVVSSDNAYVHADLLTVSSEVGGIVKAVAVRDNQHVVAGDLLFRLDDEPYCIARAGALADLNTVRLELAAERASYEEKLAAIEEAKEQAAFAGRELKRQQELAATNVTPPAALEQAEHAVNAARQHIAVLQRDAATVLASLGGPDRPDAQNPRFVAAQARVAAAERDLRKTIVKAPIAGVVANVANLPVGKFLQSGQPAFTLVATDRVWIEANLKETELTYLQSGNPVAIEIDTYPHRTWRGVVSDIGPASGAEFALIPPQNASGNWVKTVQRIPVRVAIDEQDPVRPLRAGMSAQVKIDTGHTRSLHDLTHLFAANTRVGTSVQ